MLGLRGAVASVAASVVGLKARELRPTELRIGFAVWRVRWLTPKRWKKETRDRDAAGLSILGTLEILIRDPGDLSELALAEVLLHEVLHSCISSTGVEAAVGMVKTDANREEVFVAGLAPVLLAVLRDNPGLSAYLETARR